MRISQSEEASQERQVSGGDWKRSRITSLRERLLSYPTGDMDSTEEQDGIPETLNENNRGGEKVCKPNGESIPHVGRDFLARGKETYLWTS